MPRNMSEQDIYVRFVVALAIGLAAGFERGWKQRDEPSGRREAGVRTFTIVALTGFAAGVALERFGALFSSAIALGVFALIAIIYFTDVDDDKADRGATTEVAAILTFVLGALAGAGEVLAAGITGAVLVALLHMKDELHGLLARIHEFELTAAIKLLLVSVVLLPVLPDQGYGPGGVLNPYKLWWAVVVISTIGLAGYAAMRVAGVRHGALMMGLLGGLVSSTSLTVSASRSSKAEPAASLPLAGAVATAQAVMFVRTALLIGAMNARLLELVVVPLACGAVAALIGAAIVTRRAQAGSDTVPLSPGSPDMLMAAVQFVALAALVLVLAQYAYVYAGAAGIVASGLLSGAIDVDAATLSASRMAEAGEGGANYRAAGISLVAAIIANTTVKSGISFFQGARDMAKPAIAVLAASGGATALGLAAAMMFA
jgi:uncharacterized membrane protein (DUF4010 family)